jgi:hypothetical protein
MNGKIRHRPVMTCGGCLGHRGDASAIIELPSDIRWHRSYKIEREGRCLGACKVFGPNRTKMFHVKHFGTVHRKNRTNAPVLDRTLGASP